MISELEQCTCGIVFQVAGGLNEGAIKKHFDDGTHERGLILNVCGPCFAFMCDDCDGARKGSWRCKCLHAERRLGFKGASVEDRQHRADEMRLDWSLWIARGMPQEYKPS